MKELAYYNGVITPYDAACIPLSDRAIFFGDAVYDVIIGREKKIYQRDEHLSRLYANAERIGLVDIPSKCELSEVMSELADLAEIDEFMIYIQLSADSARRAHSRSGHGVNVLITVTECNLPRTLGEIRAITLPDRRHGICYVKTINLLSAILSVEEAHRRDAEIAIFHKGDTVTECSYANVALLKQGMLITHPLDSDILPGITQANLITAANKLGIPCISRAFTKGELYSADAVIITSTTKLTKLCSCIDGVPIACREKENVVKLFDELRQDLYDKTR